MSRKIVVDADALIVTVERLVKTAHRLGWYENSLFNNTRAAETRVEFEQLERDFLWQVVNKPTVNVQGFPDGVR